MSRQEGKIPRLMHASPQSAYVFYCVYAFVLEGGSIREFLERPYVARWTVFRGLNP